MNAASPLAPAQCRILQVLIDNKPAFVAGKELAKAGGIPMNMLGNWMQAIRRAHPELTIASKIHSGYRIVEAAPTPEMIQERRAHLAERAADRAKVDDWGATSTVATILPGKGGGGTVPLHRRMAANMAILDLLPAKTAELVKTVAMNAGEDVDATLHRLISYGVEVHTDLVQSGQNPLGLARSKGQGVAEQVWQ